ncbi:MAG: response regulator [Desulfobacteraceae bacterium]|jgi:PAS domain S-box-containing protein
MRRILLVDDEVIIATQLEERLTFLGYDIVGMASSGREAVDMARRFRPDLILMDVVMPGELDGIAAARCIREELAIPVIFLTAYTDKELIERAKSLEPLGYILKPFQDEQISAAVEIALHNDRMARKLRESENRYRELMQMIPHGVVETDPNLYITFANRAYQRMLCYSDRNMEGMHIPDLTPPGEQRAALQKILPRLHSQELPPGSWIQRARTCEGRVLDVQVDWDYRRGDSGSLLGFIAVVTDITESLHGRAELQKAHHELESRIQKRTEELRAANEQLKKEIQERIRAEEELQAKRINLEEVNTALKVLLKKRDENRLEMEEKVLMNMKELALPYLEKLRNSGCSTLQEAYISILESNLNDIISPFSKRLSSRFWNFTPAELKIANLIRQGKTTKEIAILLNLSNKTVETHRKNIRKKLKINGKKANLRSHLVSIQ